MPYIVVTDVYRYEGDRHTDIDSQYAPDFHEAAIRVMRELTATSSAAETTAVMREWFKHDGTEPFTIKRSNGRKGNWYSFKYLP